MEMRSNTHVQPGRIFYLMGASGVGKDCLLHYLQTHLPASAPVRLPRRYITRPADAGDEEHIEISAENFHWQAAMGNFSMHWESHGFSYGIGKEIDKWLNEGLHVVLNGSRSYLETAQRHYPTLLPVLIRVPHDTLFERLTRRGRENSDEIEQRLQRAESLDRQLTHGDLIILNNDGPLQEAGEALLELVRSHSHRQPKVRRVTFAIG